MHEAGEVAYEQQTSVRIKRYRRDAAVNSFIRPDRGALGDVAGFRGVNADEMAHAFAVFRVLASGDVDTVLPKHRGSIDFTHTFGGGIFDRLAFLVLFIFSRIGVVFPNRL